MRKLKGFFIALLVLAVLGAGGFFGWKYLKQNNVEPVKVYNFDFVGMTEFWGDTHESYGPVSSDKIQTVYLTDTQTLSDVHVKEGQEVHKGDLLLSFDTTLSQLELERKDLEIQKTKLELEEAEKELQQISWMQPMGYPPTEPETEPTEPDLGWQLGDWYYPFLGWGRNGTSQSDAFVCWIRNDTVINDRLLMKYIGHDLKEYLRLEDEEEEEPTEEPTEEEPTEEEPTEEPSEEPTEEPVEIPTEEPTEVPSEEVPPEAPTEETPETAPQETIPEESEPTIPMDEVPSEDATIPTESEMPSTEWDEPSAVPETYPAEQEETIQSTEEQNFNTEISGNEEVVAYTDEITDEQENWESEESDFIPDHEEPVSTEPSAEEQTPIDSEPGEEQNTEADENRRHDKGWHKPIPYYMILKMTEGNYSKAEKILWIGVHVHHDGSFSFFDARYIDDYTLPREEEPETEPYVDWVGSGYTLTEIRKMKDEQTRKIKELELKIKVAEADYKLMERELSDGNIYAEIDGKVLAVVDEEEAKINQLPVVKISGGGGFYVEASVSELDRDNVEIGMEVTVSDWETGMVYDGTVSSIGDIPTEANGYNGMDNPNASSYPFTVFVDETADLRTGSYVSVQYAAASDQNGVYLQKPFVRTIQDRSFVYVRGEDGLLEERDVTTGKSIWGSYVEIIDGLTVDDLVAFPYGKNVRPGAPTAEGDMNDLYGY